MWKSAEKILGEMISMTSRDRVSLLESVSVEGYSPPPSPSERLAWRGSCKKCLQNLEGQGVRGQNLDNKGVMVSSESLMPTASALNMICLFRLGGKVRCHISFCSDQRVVVQFAPLPTNGRLCIPKEQFHSPEQVGSSLSGCRGSAVPWKRR